MSQIASIADMPEPAGVADNYPVKKLIPLTAEMAKAVTDFRFDERLATETDAYRRLIQAGLDALSRERARPKGE